MINLDEDKLHAAIVAQAADDLLSSMDGCRSMIREEVAKRLDKIFAERATAEIEATVAAAVNDGFDREYAKVDTFGRADGPKTTIRKELGHIVSGYWSEKVDKYGKPGGSSSVAVPRAEWLMAQICAKDFSDNMRQAAVSVTAALKDGFRAQLAAQVDGLLDELFRVKSLQDQGKANKPW